MFISGFTRVSPVKTEYLSTQPTEYLQMVDLSASIDLPREIILSMYEKNCGCAG